MYCPYPCYIWAYCLPAGINERTGKGLAADLPLIYDVVSWFVFVSPDDVKLDADGGLSSYVEMAHVCFLGSVAFDRPTVDSEPE